VIVFQAVRHAREVLARHFEEIEVYAVALGAKPGAVVEEEWLEPTTAAGTAKHDLSAKPNDPTPIAIPAAPVPADSQENLRWSERTSAARSSGSHPTHPLPAQGKAKLPDVLDQETVDELKLDPDTLVPHDGAETDSAKANPPDYTESPTPQNMPVIGAPDLYKRPPLVAKKKTTKAEAPAAPPPPPPPDKPRQTSRALPKAKREDPTLPDLPPDEVVKLAQSIKPEPLRPISGQIPGTSAPPPELPLLDTDGCTIAFSSFAHFRAHYETTMMHGGIIVRADPMMVGQQRALVLRIGQYEESYSLVGRVAFNGKDGSVGFMIESFLNHRPFLEGLAQRTEAAAR
jgi:hypothetical protein